jgi:membrane protein
MAREGTASEKAGTAPHEDDGRKPDSPTDLVKPSWRFTFRSAVAEFQRDQCTDLAAALTYYSVLSLFPALLAIVSLLGVVGQGESTVAAIVDLVRSIGQGDVADQLRGPVSDMVGAGGAGITLVIGLLGALWSASGYVGAFGRAMNRVYQIDEGRPIWKLRPLQLLLTLVLVVLASLVLLGLVVSGGVARAVGDAIGLGSTAVTLWNVAKWPVILVIVAAMVALLYYATPNVRQPKFRWVSVGAGIAILTWVVTSVVFGLYVANFGSYNKTYGALAGVIVFLLWLWLTNLALLLGAEVDAEMERARQLQAGIPAEESLQLPPRDTRQSDKAEAKLEERVEEARRLRESAVASGAASATATAPHSDGRPDHEPAGPGRGSRGRD